MEEPQSLKSLFARAEDRRLALEGAFDVTEPLYLEALNGAIADYTQCLQLISQLFLFSDNETLEDLTTDSLPYLLIQSDLAELVQKLHTASPAGRIRLLERARHHLERFLDQLHHYELLSDDQAKLWSTYTEDPTNFSTTPSNDPAARRNSKIANFQTEKSMKAKIEYLKRHTTASAKQGQREDGGGGNASGVGTGDDEAVRDLHLANLAYRAHGTFQALESLNREVDVLAQAPTPLLPYSQTSVEDDERRRQTAQAADSAARLDQPLRRLQSALGGGGPLLNKAGKPLQPFTIVGSRQELAQNVFRPSHNLPTMSIDEYLEEEKRRGGIIEGGGEASGIRPQVDEDDMDIADKATMKAREWDEFTEANAKGSGNTLNRG